MFNPFSTASREKRKANKAIRRMESDTEEWVDGEYRPRSGKGF